MRAFDLFVSYRILPRTKRFCCLLKGVRQFFQRWHILLSFRYIFSTFIFLVNTETVLCVPINSLTPIKLFAAQRFGTEPLSAGYGVGQRIYSHATLIEHKRLPEGLRNSVAIAHFWKHFPLLHYGIAITISWFAADIWMDSKTA
jgi:hypothetical protein